MGNFILIDLGLKLFIIRTCHLLMWKEEAEQKTRRYQKGPSCHLVENAQNDLMEHIGSMMDAQCAQERFRGALTPWRSLLCSCPRR